MEVEGKLRSSTFAQIIPAHLAVEATMHTESTPSHNVGVLQDFKDPLDETNSSTLLRPKQSMKWKRRACAEYVEERTR